MTVLTTRAGEEVVEVRLRTESEFALEVEAHLLPALVGSAV